ncbi:hypothetical protein ACFP3I_01380 [Chryseobacterium arachidis]
MKFNLYNYSKLNFNASHIHFVILTKEEPQPFILWILHSASLHSEW